MKNTWFFVGFSENPLKILVGILRFWERFDGGLIGNRRSEREKLRDEMEVKIAEGGLKKETGGRGGGHVSDITVIFSAYCMK